MRPIERRIPAYSWSNNDSDKLAVLVHGFGDHGRAIPYRLLAEFLATRGLAVISYDQRGHGEIAPGERGIAAWSDLVEDLHAVTAGLRKAHPHSTIVVIGLSMGALVALDASLSPRTAIDGVVAAAAPLGAIRASRLAVFAAKHLGRWLPLVRLRPNLDLSSIAADARAVASYVGDPLFHQVLRAGFAFELLSAAERLRLHPSAVHCPVLFLHGTSDRIAPWDPAFANGVHAHLRSARLFPGLMHNLFLETARAEVFAQITDWVDELAERGRRDVS